MLKFIDEMSYQTLLGIEGIPNNFNNLNIQASSYINRITFNRIDINNIPEEVKYATCLIINLLSKEEEEISKIGNLKSQNIEGWSETFATPEEIKIKYNKEKENVIYNILSGVVDKFGVPLLYCGV